MRSDDETSGLVVCRVFHPYATPLSTATFLLPALAVESGPGARSTIPFSPARRTLARAPSCPPCRSPSDRARHSRILRSTWRISARCARRLSFALTTIQGECFVWVASIIRSRAAVKSSQRSIASRSTCEIFQDFQRIVAALVELHELHLASDLQPELEEPRAAFGDHRLEGRRVGKELRRSAPACKSPSPARPRRDCTRSGRRVPFPSPPAARPRSAGNTIGRPPCRTAWRARRCAPGAD